MLMQWLSSPQIEAYRNAMAITSMQEQAEDQAWWDSLDMDGRARALRQVSKLIHRAEVQDRGSYRHAMYEVFDVDYSDGMNHYITLHNLIYRGLEADKRLYRMDDEGVPDEGTIDS